MSAPTELSLAALKRLGRFLKESLDAYEKDYAAKERAAREQAYERNRRRLKVSGDGKQEVGAESQRNHELMVIEFGVLRGLGRAVVSSWALVGILGARTWPANQAVCACY